MTNRLKYITIEQDVVQGNHVIISLSNLRISVANILNITMSRLYSNNSIYPMNDSSNFVYIENGWVNMSNESYKAIIVISLK